MNFNLTQFIFCKNLEAESHKEMLLFLIFPFFSKLSFSILVHLSSKSFEIFLIKDNPYLGNFFYEKKCDKSVPKLTKKQILAFSTFSYNVVVYIGIYVFDINLVTKARGERLKKSLCQFSVLKA